MEIDEKRHELYKTLKINKYVNFKPNVVFHYLFIFSGQGLHYVNGYLFTVGGGRIAFTPVSDLNKTFDSYIGK